MGYQQTARMPSLGAHSYWLAEPQSGLLAALYQSEPAPDPVKLFEGTDYVAQADQSPILFKLSAQGSFPSIIRDNPQQLNGLFITTRYSQPELLKQLRSLLEARFQKHRRAILRYYDPRVASYLLPTCTDSLQPRWLGPIQEVVWYGGTWADQLEGRQTWQSLSNDTPALAAPDCAPLALTEAQTERLIEQGYEHFAWHWIQRHPGHALCQVLAWMKVGMAAGHTDQDSLVAWLDSRATEQGEQCG